MHPLSKAVSMTDGLGVTTFEQFARVSPSPNCKIFLQQMQCTVCLDPLRLCDAICCWQCKVPTHAQCAAARSHSADGHPWCLVCKEGVMSRSAGFLQGFRAFDGQMRCGVCDEELPSWDDFCDHYDKCVHLPAQPCCQPCIHPQTGETLVAACTVVVARKDFEEHTRCCPTRQACRVAQRLVAGAVTQHLMARETQAELDTKLAQVQHSPPINVHSHAHADQTDQLCPLLARHTARSNVSARRRLKRLKA